MDSDNEEGGLDGDTAPVTFRAGDNTGDVEGVHSKQKIWPF